MPTGKLAKWKILLSKFDIVYVTQKAVKGQALADHLAENFVGGQYEPLKMYFLDEEVSFVGEDIAEAYSSWRMFFDGAANFKGVGIGAVLVSETGQHYPVSTKLRFPCTNNMAEYEACITGLNQAIDMNIQEVLVIGDSDLLVHQVQGEWAMKNTKILSDLMKANCETFKIKHKTSTSYRPQMNGSVEAANKNIKKILRKIVENHKQWHEKLPFSLLGYLTMVRTSTGETPYLLVYGTEAVIPAEVEIPSLRIIHEAELSDAEWIRSRYEQLALIDRKIMNAVCHGQIYHNKMSKAFNKKVKPRQFTQRQLVLKKIFPHQDEAKGKLSPNWQGPYMVHRVLTGGALILAEMDGEVWPKPIHSDAVKRYYV
ncbi:uncharacterized protein [Nicotiana sylvestris]|uniref:uncharacterized protein n=1 Tax=Nicotiana sylvestris TaxID=4096 RepID=UPI00388C3E5D